MIEKYFDWLDNIFNTWVAVIIATLSLLIVIFVPLFFCAVIVTNIAMGNFQERCLESQSIRRFRVLDYDEAVCEELMDDEWVIIDPDSKNPIIYNYNHYNEIREGE